MEKSNENEWERFKLYVIIATCFLMCSLVVIQAVNETILRNLPQEARKAMAINDLNDRQKAMQQYLKNLTP